MTLTPHLGAAVLVALAFGCSANGPSNGPTGTAGGSGATSSTGGSSGSSAGSGSTSAGAGSGSGGSTGAAGLPNGSRCDPLDGGCSSGAACLLAFDGGTFCLVTCDISKSGVCPADEVCGPILPPLLSACFPLSDAGCELGNLSLAPELSFTYEPPCATTLDCPCPYACLPDSNLGDGGYCGQRCSTTSDCIDPQRHCVAGFCSFDFCIANLQHPVSNGLVFDGVCDGTDAGDGNCLPTLGPNGYLGLCRQAGTVAVGGACDAVAGRTQLSRQCAAGGLCIPDSGATEYGNCAALCTPSAVDAGSSAVRCPDGSVCGLPDPLQPLLGACQAP